MALTKEIVVEKIEVVRSWNVQVATDTVIKEDGVESVGQDTDTFLFHSHHQKMGMTSGHIQPQT